MGLTEVMSASSRSLHSRASSTSSTATADDVAAIADLLAAQKTQELALDPRALPQTVSRSARVCRRLPSSEYCNEIGSRHWHRNRRRR